MDNQVVIENNQLDNTNLKKKPSSKLPIVLLSVFSVICLCFGAYGMFFRGQNTISPSESANPNQSEDTSVSGDSEDLDPYVERDLRTKVFRLLGSRNGFIELERYNRGDKSFIVSMGYMPVKELLSNSLTDEMKVYIALETASAGKDKYCAYRWTEGVKDDINTATAYDETVFSDSTVIDCVSYEDAKNDYKDLFGEEMPKLVYTKGLSYGDFTYGSNLDAYYFHIIGGRGGTGADYIMGKINEITKDGDSIKVIISAGVLYINRNDPGQLYSSIEQEEVYKTYDGENTDWGNLGLTDDDYASFKTYSFVFEKNSDGIYSFVRVE